MEGHKGDKKSNLSMRQVAVEVDMSMALSVGRLQSGWLGRAGPASTAAGRQPDGIKADQSGCRLGGVKSESPHDGRAFCREEGSSAVGWELGVEQGQRFGNGREGHQLQGEGSRHTSPEPVLPPATPQAIVLGSDVIDAHGQAFPSWQKLCHKICKFNRLLNCSLVFCFLLYSPTQPVFPLL